MKWRRTSSSVSATALTVLTTRLRPATRASFVGGSGVGEKRLVVGAHGDPAVERAQRRRSEQVRSGGRLTGARQRVRRAIPGEGGLLTARRGEQRVADAAVGGLHGVDVVEALGPCGKAQQRRA